MGTTLTNGIYLPNEGEKNCYAGLKTNWETLDQKIADIAALQQAVAGALHREIVESLPTTDIDPNTIYMILSGTSATENVYDEFMYVNNAWELIGTSATDLTNYYTKAEVDGKLLLKANASDLTSHTGDTTIHVTASDKTKWNTVALIKQLRLVNTQVGSATTIAFANIDDTNGIKVGDKCMDLDAKMFEITAVDTTNETVTVGSALIDLALDANVVHKSGDETIGGLKTFENNRMVVGRSTDISSAIQFINSDVIGDSANGASSFEVYGSSISDANKIGSITIGEFSNNGGSYATIESNRTVSGVKSSNAIRSLIRPNGSKELSATVDNDCKLGTEFLRWSKIYGTEYYYGSNNVEFSTKFVTTDTVQDISANKNFQGLLTTIPSSSLWPDVSNTSDDITYLGANAIHVEQKSSGKLTDLSGGAWNVVELGLGCFFFRYNSGTDIRYKQLNTGDINRIPVVSGANRFINDVTPNQDNTYNLGSSSLRWQKINGLNPGALSLPDLNNGIDISSYITDLTGASNVNKYIPSVNGWVSIGLSNADFIEIYIPASLMGATFTKSTMNNTSLAFMPVIANKEVKITLKGSSIGWAKFYPCQGNV